MCASPILVISDTHFGFETESAVRFQHFMTYLTNAVQSGRMIIKKSHEQSDELAETTLSEEALEAPQKIVLLGDIIDLWISRDKNTLRPYKESFNIFNSLIALNREIVWLLGNHEGIMDNYEGTYHLPEGASFTVYHGHYPYEKEDGRCKGEQIGERSYFFLHGHQFDLVFRHGRMLRLGNFVGFSSATAGGFLWFKLLGAIAFFLTIGVVFSAFVWNWLPSLLSGLIDKLEPWPPLAGFLLLLLWLVGAIAFLGLLWPFNFLARWYYNDSLHPGHTRKGAKKEKKKSPSPLWKKIHKSIGNYYFSRKEQHIDADVIISGHTHEPYIEPYTSKNGQKKLHVNSGSWIVQRDNIHDTFVYIDDNGVRLLKWHDDSGCVSQRMSSLL